MARVRIDDNVNQPSGRVIVVVPGLKVQVVQPGTTTAVTVYQAETGGSTHSWFGTDARGVVVPFTADPATTGVAIAGGEMWVETGQTVELRVLQAAVEVGRKRYPAISPSVERRSVFADDYCVGDGTTDDTAGLLAAITAADGKKLVFRPDATYLYSNIVYTATNGVTIDGQGATLKSSLALTTNTAEFWVKGSDVTIRDLIFTQSVSVDVATQAVSRGANAHTLRVGGVSAGAPAYRVAVENVHFLQSRNSPILIQYVDTLRITGCNLKNALGNGIFVGDSFTDIRIEGNSILNTGDDGIGVYQNTGMAGPISGVVIANNTIETSDAKGIGVGADDVTITGNVIKNTYTGCIEALGDNVFNLRGANRVTIVGNVVEDGGKCFGSRLHATASANAHCIHVYGSNTCSDITIADNEVYNAEQRGIQVTQGNRIAIKGNAVNTCGGPGIAAGNPDGSNYTDVVGLTISNNEVKNTVGGIVVGTGAEYSIHGNRVSSYDVGGAGTHRGIQVGSVSVASIHGNTIINDNAGAAHTIVYNASLHVREWGNFRWTTGDADLVITALVQVGLNRVGFGSAAPTVGAWAQGDVIFSTGAGGSTLPSASGWQCRAAGSPGTWKQFGAIGIAPYSASATWDPGSVADGAVTSTTVTVTGVGIADACEVMVGHSAGIPAGAILAGSVTSANTVTVTLFNHTGSALDVASGTLRVTAYKHQ